MESFTSKHFKSHFFLCSHTVNEPLHNYALQFLIHLFKNGAVVLDLLVIMLIWIWSTGLHLRMWTVPYLTASQSGEFLPSVHHLIQVRGGDCRHIVALSFCIFLWHLPQRTLLLVLPTNTYTHPYMCSSPITNVPLNVCRFLCCRAVQHQSMEAFLRGPEAAILGGEERTGRD